MEAFSICYAIDAIAAIAAIENQKKMVGLALGLYTLTGNESDPGKSTTPDGLRMQSSHTDMSRSLRVGSAAPR